MASAPNTGYFATLLKNKPPWGIYSAEAYTSGSSSLFDLTGNGRDATVTGTTLYANGDFTTFGSINYIKYLQGTTGTYITWPSGSIPANAFTICSITRYMGTGNANRILTSTNENTYNLLHGHWAGYRGAMFYAGWLSKYAQQYGTATDWLVCCGSIGGGISAPYTSIVDGNFIGYDGGVPSYDGVGLITSTPYTLCINQSYLNGGLVETSDFGFSQLIIWDQALTPDEMMCVSNVFTQYLADGVYIAALTRTPLYNLINTVPPWGMYSAEFSTNNTLSDLTGNGRHATMYRIGIVSGGGYGATANINMIYGDTDSNIVWPAGSLPAHFTICSLTRYAGSTDTTRQHILAGKTTNVFHGHDAYRRGVAHYQAHVTNANAVSQGTATDWLIMCGRTSGSAPTNILIDNGIAIGNLATSSISPDTLVINAATVYPYSTLNSDFAFSQLIIWDQELTTSQMRVVANSMQQYLKTGIEFANEHIYNKFVSNGVGLPLLFKSPPYKMTGIPTNYVAYGLDAGNRALPYGQGCIIDTGFKVNGVDFGQMFQSDIVNQAVSVSTSQVGNDALLLPFSLPLWNNNPSTSQPAITMYFYSSLYVTSSYLYQIRILSNYTATVSVVNGANTTQLTSSSAGTVEISPYFNMSTGLNMIEIAATNTAGGTAYVNMSIYDINGTTFKFGTNSNLWTMSRFRPFKISGTLKWYTYSFLDNSSHRNIAYVFYSGTGAVYSTWGSQNMSWLVIGGGGGGGAGSTNHSGSGSGGGGGGLIFDSGTMLNTGGYGVTVGVGGVGGVSPTAGTGSTFGGANASGGNPGSSGTTVVQGGSGGVGSGVGYAYSGGTGGSNGVSGTAETAGSFSTAFPTGVTFTTGSVTYSMGCGGGGGGAYSSTTSGAAGGNVGGGAGGKMSGAGRTGIVNIGGGGGGGGNSALGEYVNYSGGKGGAGVVILYYPYHFNSGAYTYTDT